METRQLGKTGIFVSEVGFGGAPAGLKNYLGHWDPDLDRAQQQVINAIAHAVALGITYFDTAPGYGGGASESMFGRGLKPFQDKVVIASKVNGRTRDDILRSVEASLERLQINRLDILQYHGDWYTTGQVQEILSKGGALEGLQAAQTRGLAKHIGFTTEGLGAPVDRLVETRSFDVIQLCYNLIYQHPCDPSRKAGILYTAEELGMGIIVMRTLTSGIFQRWLGIVFPDVMSTQSRQAELNQALLSFVLSNPLVDVALVGMRTAQEVDQNAAAVLQDRYRVDLDKLHQRYV